MKVSNSSGGKFIRNHPVIKAVPNVALPKPHSKLLLEKKKKP